MKKRMGDMTEPELRDLLNRVGQSVEGVLRAQTNTDGQKPKFIVLFFDCPRTGQYVSTIRRQDAIKAMREAADRFERNEDIPR